MEPNLTQQEIMGIEGISAKFILKLYSKNIIGLQDDQE